jgi:hypothetical protein
LILNSARQGIFTATIAASKARFRSKSRSVSIQNSAIDFIKMSSGVFSNPGSEPILNGGELNEGEVGSCELVIASRDSAEAFDAAEEVFYPVA